METRIRKGIYTRLAKQLIREMPELRYIAESRVRLVFLSSDMEKKKGNKAVLGQCEKIPDKFKWRIPYDFMITVFEPNVERFDRDKTKILLFHELLHVGIEVDGNEEKYFVREHDYEEFAEIMRRYGIDWSEDVEA